MNILITTGYIIIFALSLFQVVLTKPSFELRDGQCDETSNGTASGEDLVYKDRITLGSLPFMTNSQEVSSLKFSHWKFNVHFLIDAVM